MSIERYKGWLVVGLGLVLLVASLLFVPRGSSYVGCPACPDEAAAPCPDEVAAPCPEPRPTEPCPTTPLPTTVTAEPARVEHLHDEEENNCYLTTRKKWNIALFTAATGSYRIECLPKFLDTFQHFFFSKDNLTIFLFVDELVPERPNVVQFVVPKRPWGEASMARWNYILGLTNTLQAYDYAGWMDVDNYVREHICDDYMSSLTLIRHAQWPTARAKTGPYEDRPSAASYVHPDKRKVYFTGSQFFGSVQEVLSLARVCQKMKEDDDARGLVAKVVDESHLNAYAHNVRWPDKVLSPSYAFQPEFEVGEKETGLYVKRIIHGNKRPPPGLY